MTEYDLGKVTGEQGPKGDKGDTGNTGNGISKIELYSTSGKQKTYRITYTNGNHFDYVVTDGADGEATIVTSWESTLSDTKVPSEKLVKNSLPTKTSDLTNDGDGTNVFVKNNDSRLTDSRTPTSHTHGNLQNNGQVGSTAQANYNVVTDSNGKITTEAKPTIPQASSTTPSADTTNGSAGSGTTWAKADHTHPKSSIYAESSHTHTKSQITDFPSIPTKTSDLTNDGDGTNVFVKNNDSRLTDSRTPTSHTHTKSQITDFPTIPSKISDLTDDSDFIKTSSTSGLVKNDGTIDTSSYATTGSLATVATTGDYDDLTDKPTIPSDVSDLTDSTGVIPTDVSDLSDTSNTPFTPKSHAHGNIDNSGILKISGTAQASKPLITNSSGVIIAGAFGTSSGQFAEGNHTHSAYVNPTIADNLTTDDATQVLSAKQGKVLKDLIGDAISYINQ